MILNKDWNNFLADELSKEYFLKLLEFLKYQYTHKIIYPQYENIFRAFNLLPLNKVKVVIIGQDPYHGANQANGLAFSVSKNIKIPPSLLNIYKELSNDLGYALPVHGDLTLWAKEGVLLINSILSVEASLAHSHKNVGWEIFTDSVIAKLSMEFENLVFILWGLPAQKKEILIDEKKHLILKAPHPSPLSAYRGFFGSKPFSKSNEYLLSHNKVPVCWSLSEI